MAPPSFLELGQLLELEVVRGTRVERFRSAVLEVTPVSYAVAVPRGDDEVRLRLRDTLSCMAVTPEGIFSFETFVLRLSAMPSPHAILSLPADHRRIQRRGTVRILDAIGVIFTYSLDGREEVFRCQSRDLSAGGLKAVAPKPVPREGSVGEVRFTLPPDPEPVWGPARVVRITPTRKAGEVEFSVELTGLKATDRDRITRYIFARQLEARRRRVPR
jgi:c-di-GMP-binding flagellar brake protein YcgR